MLCASGGGLRTASTSTSPPREPAAAEYLRVTPKGRSPARDRARALISENPAILAYVAQSHPAARLAPLDDPFEFARMQAFNSYLCATVHVAHAHLRRPERWADDSAARAELKRKAPEVVANCFQLIEDEFLTGPVGAGRRVQRRRLLPVHAHPVAAGAPDRLGALSQGTRPPDPHARAPRGAGRAGAEDAAMR